MERLSPLLFEPGLLRTAQEARQEGPYQKDDPSQRLSAGEPFASNIDVAFSLRESIVEYEHRAMQSMKLAVSLQQELSGSRKTFDRWRIQNRMDVHMRGGEWHDAE